VAYLTTLFQLHMLHYFESWREFLLNVHCAVKKFHLFYVF